MEFERRECPEQEEAGPRNYLGKCCSLFCLMNVIAVVPRPQLPQRAEGDDHGRSDKRYADSDGRVPLALPGKVLESHQL